MISLDDARRLLGRADDAEVDEVRAARRRLAKHRHPDVAGGDSEAMRQLNEAADVILVELGAPPDGARAASATVTRSAASARVRRAAAASTTTSPRS